MQSQNFFGMSGLAYVSFSTFWSTENKLTVECFLADFFSRFAAITNTS